MEAFRTILTPVFRNIVRMYLSRNLFSSILLDTWWFFSCCNLQFWNYLSDNFLIFIHSNSGISVIQMLKFLIWFNFLTSFSILHFLAFLFWFLEDFHNLIFQILYSASDLYRNFFQDLFSFYSSDFSFIIAFYSCLINAKSSLNWFFLLLLPEISSNLFFGLSAFHFREKPSLERCLVIPYCLLTFKITALKHDF